jgi:hypothetical protein
VPSFRVSQYDIIDVRPKSLETTPFLIARETYGDRPIPGWLQVVPSKLRVLSPAARACPDRRSAAGAADRGALLQELRTIPSGRHIAGAHYPKSNTVLIVQRPVLSEEPTSDSRSRFVIEPLEPGFGYTLGNSLRRTLLSSIPGAAVTSIRIDGVLHEFTTVEGVKEDVTDIILNLKELVVSSESEEPVVMYLRKQGPER